MTESDIPADGVPVEGDVNSDSRMVPPECRIPATVNPAGLLRFEVSDEQAREIYQEVCTAHENAVADEFIPVRFVLDQQAYEDVTSGLETLQSHLPQVGVVQISLAHEPAYALTVVVDAEQITDTLDSNHSNLDAAEPGELYAQEFQISPNAALLVMRQMEEAFDGAQDPVEAIDIDAIRQNASK